MLKLIDSLQGSPSVATIQGLLESPVFQGALLVLITLKVVFAPVRESLSSLARRVAELLEKKKPDPPQRGRKKARARKRPAASRTNKTRRCDRCIGGRGGYRRRRLSRLRPRRPRRPHRRHFIDQSHHQSPLSLAA